jgi:hypothetical protein
MHRAAQRVKHLGSQSDAHRASFATSADNFENVEIMQNRKFLERHFPGCVFFPFLSTGSFPHPSHLINHAGLLQARAADWPKLSLSRISSGLLVNPIHFPKWFLVKYSSLYQ